MAKDHQLPEYHVLDFAHDDDNRCTLTALVHHIRYHISVDPSRWDDQPKDDSKLATEYTNLPEKLEQKEKQVAEEIQQQEEHSQKDDGYLHDTRDSGIDIPHDDDSTQDASSTKEISDPRTALHNWILSPLTPEFSHRAPKPTASDDKRTVQEWYHSESAFYHLLISAGRLEAQPEDPSGPSLTRAKNLLPSLHLPKYILNLDIPSFAATDLFVLSESADPAPFHPTLVRDRQSNQTFFLKLVDPSQPQPTKREIRLLKEIERKRLHEQIRVPLVRGLVHFSPTEDERSKKGTTRPIIGFLLDAIASPTPLTLLLDPEISQERRERWAKESARMVEVLHQEGIVWGDAKGDNFVVDADDELWIIDFGGSYTPGWIDPELNETVEGDEQGVRKVVGGLRDPEENTIRESEGNTATEEEDVATKEEESIAEDEGEEDEDEDDEKENVNEEEKNADERTSGVDGKKRRRMEEGDDEEVEPESQRKQRKVESGDERGFCFCGGDEAGKMIACDGEKCETEWFHMSCVGVEEAPEGKWFCQDCESR